MQRILVSLAMTAAALLSVAASAKDATVHVKVTGRLSTADPVEIAILTKAASGLKPTTVASTNPQGEATLFLNTFANVSKKERVQVYARVCQDGK